MPRAASGFADRMPRGSAVAAAVLGRRRARRPHGRGQSTRPAMPLARVLIIAPPRATRVGREATTGLHGRVKVGSMLEEARHRARRGSQAWLRRTLEEIVSQVRRLLDVTGVSFLVVDPAHAHIGPAASWFESDAVREAFVPVLDRPVRARARGRHRGRGGDGQPGADRAHRGLARRRGTAPAAVRAPRRRDRAERLWDWYSTSSFISVPGAHERRAHPRRAGDRRAPRRSGRSAQEDLRVTEVFADLGGVRARAVRAARPRGRAGARRAAPEPRLAGGQPLRSTSARSPTRSSARRPRSPTRRACGWHASSPGRRRCARWRGRAPGDRSRRGLAPARAGSVGRVAQGNQVELDDDVAARAARRRPAPVRRAVGDRRPERLRDRRRWRGWWRSRRWRRRRSPTRSTTTASGASRAR